MNIKLYDVPFSMNCLLFPFTVSMIGLSLCLMLLATGIARLIPATQQVALFTGNNSASRAAMMDFRLMLLDVDRHFQAAVALPGMVVLANWSPDGQKLLILLSPNGDVDWRQTPFWEWDRRTLTNRTDLLVNITSFDYLPDGDLLVVHQLPVAGRLGRISPDGSEQPLIDLPGAYQLDVSPTGRQALVTGMDNTGQYYTEWLDLTTLTHHLVSAASPSLSSDQWSWSGDDLIYIREGTQIQHQTPDGQEITLWRLASPALSSASPATSTLREMIMEPLIAPDLQALAFRVTHDPYSDLFTLRLDQADPAGGMRGLKQVTAPRQRPADLNWSSDSRPGYTNWNTRDWEYIFEGKSLLRFDFKMGVPLWRPAPHR